MTDLTDVPLSPSYWNGYEDASNIRVSNRFSDEVAYWLGVADWSKKRAIKIKEERLETLLLKAR